jgi:hypothetical protein
MCDAGSRPELEGSSGCPLLAISLALQAQRLLAFGDQSPQDPWVLLEHGLSFLVQGR